MRVVYTQLLFWAGGFTVNQNLILINSKYTNDTRLVEHEKVHIAQMKKVGTLKWWFNYIISKKFRLSAELEAYKKQASLGADINRLAYFLSHNYFLGITQEQALEYLK